MWVDTLIQYGYTSLVICLYKDLSVVRDQEVGMDALRWPFSEEILRQLATAGIIVVLVAVVARVVMLFVDSIVVRLTGRTKTELDDLIINAVRTPIFVFIVLIGVRVGLLQLTFLDDVWQQVFERVLSVGFLLIGYILLHRLIGELLTWYGSRLAAKTQTSIDEQLVPFLRRVIQLVLLAITLIMIMAHFGLNISALVATLGVSSLAFALAAQAFLADTIAGFLIMVDRPFSVGDRIQLPQEVMGEYGDWGDVAEIGIRSTRIRSTDGVMLTVPNSKLTNEVVINFSHSESPNLRVRLRLSVEPELQNVRRAVAEIESIAARDPDISPEPREPEVVIREIGDCDVLVELRFYVDDARKMRRTKSRVTEKILAVFEEKGIEIAAPMQVVHLVQEDSSES
jgi:small-conductance mechanosensitive channel